ncbi:MAG: fliN [Alphaproteobacteria bacterium]|nr:fliN [Alphaproteobacteria bacterium]
MTVKETENVSFDEIPEEPKKPESDHFYDDVSPEKELHAIYDIPVQVSAVLGRTTMQVSQLLKLGRGAVVNLDRRIGEPIDVYVNNRLVARGEVVVVDDKLGITMTEIVKSEG